MDKAEQGEREVKAAVIHSMYLADRHILYIFSLSAETEARALCTPDTTAALQSPI